MLRGGWAAGDAYQWMFDEQTALFPSTYLHYTADDSPSPLNAFGVKGLGEGAGPGTDHHRAVPCAG